MRFMQVRNATARIEYGGCSFLLDPWLASAGPVERPAAGEAGHEEWGRTPAVDLPLSLKALTSGLSALIVTSTSHDRFDPTVVDAVGASCPSYFVRPTDRAALARAGLADLRPLGSEDACLGRVGLRLAPSLAEAGPDATGCGQGGLLLQAPDEPTLYLAGDTGPSPRLAGVIEEAEASVIVISAADSSDPTRSGMDAEDVIAICKATPETLVIVSRLGALRQQRLTREGLAASVRAAGLGERVIIPGDGEDVDLELGPAEREDEPARPPTLFIDADACPVIREALAAARTEGTPCVIAGNTTQNLSRHVRSTDPTEPRDGFWVSTLQASVGADSADFAIVRELRPHDVLVTQDIGLASIALGRGARAIGVRGRVYEPEAIDSMLLVRHEERRLRRAGGRTQGPRAFTERDRRRFVRTLRRLLAEA